MKLYEIEGKLRDLIERLDATDDPLEYEMIMSEIDKVEGDRSEKLANCCAYLKNLTSDEDALRLEIAKLKDKLSKVENRKERFKAYIASCLSSGEKWKNSIHSISWRKSSRVVIVDRDKIPLEYLRQKITVEPDLEAAKRIIAGENKKIEGLELVTINNIQVR